MIRLVLVLVLSMVIILRGFCAMVDYDDWRRWLGATVVVTFTLVAPALAFYVAEPYG